MRSAPPRLLAACARVVALTLFVLGGCAAGPTESAVPLLRTCTVDLTFATGAVSGDVLVESPDLAAPVPLTLDGRGLASGQVERAPGPFRWRFRVGPQAFLDPSAPLTVLTPDGVEWSFRDVPDCDRAALVLGERADFPDGLDVSLRVLRSRDGAPLAPQSVRVSLDGEDRTTDAEASADAIWISLRGVATGKHALVVQGADARGRPIEPLSAPFWVDPAPFRWEDAIVYQVMVDRFAGEDGAPLDAPPRPGLRAGGRLSGVRAALESGALSALGVNTLWLSPLYDNPEEERPGIAGGPEPYVGYHGYWPAAPREVEPAFGDAAEVEALVGAAHARGMRVLLDVVPNHVDITSPVYRASPSWFSTTPCMCGGPDCPWTTHIETCWFTAYMPDVDFSARGALDAQVEDALWWMSRFNLDGLRVDAVPMMPRLVIRHLADRVRARFEGLRERHFLLGETYTGLAGHDWIRWYLGPDGLDGQFDYPVLWALRDTLAYDRAPLSALAATMDAGQRAWSGSASVMGNTIGNHDVSRFASDAGGGARGLARAALAHAVVFTSPGMPIVYYGDEVGLEGGGDPDNRRVMPADAALSPNALRLRDTVASLAHLRRCEVSLRRGPLTWLVRAEDALAWRRTPAGAPAVDVVLNRASSAVTLTLSRDDVPVTAAGVSTQQRISAHTVAVTVPAQAFAVLIPPESPCAPSPAP